MLFKNSKKVLGFDDTYYALAGIYLNTHTAMAIFYTGSLLKVSFSDYSKKWVGELLSVIILWLVIRALYLKLVEKNPGIKNVKKRFLIIPLYLVPYALISIGYQLTVQPYFDWNYAEYPQPSAMVQLLTGMLLFFVDIGCYEALHLFVEIKDVKLKEEQLKKESITTQLMGLKAQLSPHFLFNSLNTLAFLIDEDPNKSKEFVKSLSNVYQKISEISDKPLITLTDELDYIKDYVELLKKRHGDNLYISFNLLDSDVDKKIVPLSLQVGIENAVKHNIISKNHPLKINVFSNDGYVEIKNNLQRKTQDNLTGYGLKNIKNRYALLTEKRVVINQNSNQFTIKLPLLSK